ncbi:sugar phosphate nucleotidyltransferase [Methylocucumis oryzae]|uniref:sugar phosphate nucleotidyltransferase n=1 Tax=Methylocucumis oryzae TaxID=1632867 RepID=UPI0012FEC8E6|nr:sugar phosphate nucleotidyltransferase [Methylocucumis oryzae]
MSKVNTAIILAGGLGTRLRSVVSELPKPMASVSGRPFLEHLMDYWFAQGVTRFILSVGYQSDIITTHFGAHYRHARIDYAIESEPLGTGGGLFYALQEVDETVLVLNGDTFFSVALDELADFHKNHDSSWTFFIISHGLLWSVYGDEGR